MKAVFVFCEGNHDVTFVVRSLGQMANATWVSDPIGKLPSPLGPVLDPANPIKPKVESLIARRYSNRSLEELRLQAAAHAPLPAFDAIVQVGETLYVLIRCHGDGAAKAAIDLLADIRLLLNPIYATDITDFAAAFLFDADDSLQQRESDFALEFNTILNGVSSPTHSQWVTGSHRIGLYVFHDQASPKKSGSLEELIAPLVQAEWGARWVAAGAYLNENAMAADPVKTKNSELLKAQINVTGQFLFPGDPMSIVIGKPKPGKPGLANHHFKTQASQDLVRFLGAVPW